jgi:hypothetical protein
MRLVGRFLLLIGLIAASSAQAKVIDFESLNAPGNGAGGLVVKNQFQADGIIFQNASALDYSQGIPIPNFAHSGTKAIEVCRAAEFCTAPLELTFTTAQRRVKLWVGYSFTLAPAQAVVMRAFDVFGNPVGTATHTLGPSSGVIPVSTPFEITMPFTFPRIVRVTVSFLGAEAPSPTMFNNSLTVDDVEFDTEGSPPTCPATQPPGIGMIAPFDGEIVVQNAFTVDVNISTPDPFATIQIRATGPNNQIITFGPVFVTSGHVTFANLSGLLFPGSNTVDVQVKDCAGANDRTATVIYRNDLTRTPILVIDEDNHPVPAAEVYANGVLLGRTDQSGEFNASPPLSDGTDLVARKFVLESSTYRGNHSQGSTRSWKFRVYLSNLAVQNDGILSRQSVKLEPNPLAFQVVKILRANTLFGLHWVASIEWDASQAEMEAVRQKLIAASHFLYNATDGQLLLEQAEIVNNGALWEDADIRVYANQSLREFVDDPLGGFFDNSIWSNGSWIHVQIKSAGSTYAHEFGHYGFGTSDEYSDDDESVQCTAQLALGTIPPGLNPFQAGMPQASCMMFYQGQAAKICSSRSGNPHVHGTAQGDSSCWSTLIDHYKDDNNNPRWLIQSPDTRGAIPGQINATNPPLTAWAPRIAFQPTSHPNLCAPISVRAVNSDGMPAAKVEVWLHTTYGADILQGKTNNNGEITVTGVHSGDHVEELAILPADCRPVALFAPTDATSALPHPLSPALAQASQGAKADPAPRAVVVEVPAYHVFTTLTPGKGEGTGELLVRAETADAKPVALKGPPQVAVKPVGHGAADLRKLPLKFDARTKSYSSTIDRLPLDAELAIQITATDSQGKTRNAIGRFQVSRPDPTKDTDIVSADGQLKIRVSAHGLPQGARVSIGPPAVRPPVLTGGEVLVSGPYRIASNAQYKLAKPATLRFQLPRDGGSSATAGFDPKSFKVVEYDAASGKWVDRGGVLHPSPIDVLSYKAPSLGTFAVVARKE